jgi:hypothetical protein
MLNTPTTTPDTLVTDADRDFYRALGVTVEDLMGEEAPPSKRGPAPQLQQRIERLTDLPKAQQRVVLQMLDGVLAQAAR